MREPCKNHKGVCYPDNKMPEALPHKLMGCRKCKYWVYGSNNMKQTTRVFIVTFALSVPITLVALYNVMPKAITEYEQRFDNGYYSCEKWKVWDWYRLKVRYESYCTWSNK